MDKDVGVRDENSFAKEGSSEEGKKWLESNCMLEVELADLLNGLKMDVSGKGELRKLF